MKSISVSRTLSYPKKLQAKEMFVFFIAFPSQRHDNETNILKTKASKEQDEKNACNASDEHITKHRLRRPIIISFINAIVRNYNFLFKRERQKWKEKNA